jgi:hypothetical protein
MLNNPINILDGICYSFTVIDNKIILLQSNGGFKNIQETDHDKIVPYLARNPVSPSEVQWEMGFGRIVYQNNSFSVERVKVTASSAQNEMVEFVNLNNPLFYVLANEYNFNTGFQNAILKNNNFTVDNIQSVYLIDNKNADIDISLVDSKDNQNLVFEFKLLHNDSSYKVNVKKPNSAESLLVLDNNKTYSKIISYGYDWIELLDSNERTNLNENLEEQNFNTQSVVGVGLPGGDPYSLQFNSSGSFDGAPLYYVEDKLLVGGSGISLASNIFPLSNSGNMVFNNKNYASDFIVKGSGDKNLYFSYDGKLGVNIPSGLRPATALHLINNNCSEGIRLENRNQCHSANLTLYHKPSTVPPSGTISSTINMAAKNSVANQVNYVQLKSRILNSTIGQTAGEFIVSVENSGNSVDVLTINNNRFRAAIGSNSLEISPSGLDMTGMIRLSNFDIDGGVIVFSGLSSDNSPSTSPTPTATVTPTITPTTTPTPTPSRP